MGRLVLIAVPLLMADAGATGVSEAAPSSDMEILVPATPVMAVYQFGGDLEVPYFDRQAFAKRGTKSARPAGKLAVGTRVIPCLVLHEGAPLTTSDGTPYVGFEVVFDPKAASPEAVATLEQITERRRGLRVPHHHCPSTTPHVIDVRKLVVNDASPHLSPPPNETSQEHIASSRLDTIVRAFHNSPQCHQANLPLLQRRQRLEQAWESFIEQQRQHWAAKELQRAKHLDYAMRTALFEGHLDRGCSAYGACERNVILLSLRNRARTRCQAWQGCRSRGDYQGVASSVSQYNIWDEYFTQISRVSACYLRSDLAATSRLAQMYAHTVAQAETILFGKKSELRQLFPEVQLDHLQQLRHYYHPPAMGKCFPEHPRLEYISGAVAQRQRNYVLLANTRIGVDEEAGDGYTFRNAVIESTSEGDRVSLVDAYPGFVVDGRKVSLRAPSSCAPYGLPRGCDFSTIGRYRRTPPWLTAGTPAQMICDVIDRGPSCEEPPTPQRVELGGVCDTEMQPVAKVH